MELRDREAAEETWRVHAKFYKDIPSPSTEGIKEVMAFLAQTDPDVLKLDAQRLIDTEFTDRLQKEMGK